MIRATTIVAALACARVAHAQEPSSDEDVAPTEDLDEIEAALGEDAASAEPAPVPRTSTAGLKALLNPDLTLILNVAAAWFWPGDGEPLQTGEHDPTSNGFNLQGLELAVGKAVDPYFRFDGNLVFSGHGVDLEEAYATTLALPHGLQARAGQFLTRFGRINPTHPHAWDLVDQPLALGRVFGGEGNIGLGAELSWLTPLPWFVEVIGAVTNPEGARSFVGDEEEHAEGEEEEGGLESPRDLQATAIVEQFFELTPDWSLLLGVSYATGPHYLGVDTRTDLYGVDLYLKWRPITRASYQEVELQTEWIVRRRQRAGDALVDTTGYAQLAWRFARRWSVATRWDFGTGNDDDDLDPDWTDDRHRATGALTFYPTEFSRLRLQGSVDSPAWADPITAAFLQLEVVVGAHGAHPF